MRRMGRKVGYLLGAVMSVGAGLLAARGIYIEAFILFCIAAVFAGLYSSYVLSYRFAAVGNTQPAPQARSISWVLTGSLLAADDWDKQNLLVFPAVGVVVIALLWLAG